MSKTDHENHYWIKSNWVYVHGAKTQHKLPRSTLNNKAQALHVALCIHQVTYKSKMKQGFFGRKAGGSATRFELLQKYEPPSALCKFVNMTTGEGCCQVRILLGYKNCTVLTNEIWNWSDLSRCCLTAGLDLDLQKNEYFEDKFYIVVFAIKTHGNP